MKKAKGSSEGAQGRELTSGGGARGRKGKWIRCFLPALSEFAVVLLCCCAEHASGESALGPQAADSIFSNKLPAYFQGDTPPPALRCTATTDAVVASSRENISRLLLHFFHLVSMLKISLHDGGAVVNPAAPRQHRGLGFDSLFDVDPGRSCRCPKM